MHQNTLEVPIHHEFRFGTVSLETSFGFSNLWWNPRDLPDGSYDLRLRAVCSSSNGIRNPPPGLDEAVSGIVVGHLDRTPPAAFRWSEPAVQEVMPGDEVSVTFLEPLQCDEPHRFGVHLSVIGSDLRLDNRNLLDTACRTSRRM